jgi:hypothetical protein
MDEPEKFNATMVELVRPLTSLPVARSAPARRAESPHQIIRR